MKAITALFAAFLILTSFAQQTPSTSEVGMINWMTWDQAMEAQKITPRKIFIDVYTDWCGYCKKMDQTTFKNSDVIRALSDDFYAVKFDAEIKETITYNGEDYVFKNEGRRPSHQLAQALLDGRMAYPSFVYLDEQLRKIMPSPGYKKPIQLLTELEFISTESYTEMSWEDYVKRAD
jgi:thioredoxin-related protein